MNFLSLRNPVGYKAEDAAGMVPSRIGGEMPSGRAEGKGDLGLVGVLVRLE